MNLNETLHCRLEIVASQISLDPTSPSMYTWTERVRLISAALALVTAPTAASAATLSRHSLNMYAFLDRPPARCPFRSSTRSAPQELARLAVRMGCIDPTLAQYLPLPPAVVEKMEECTFGTMTPQRLFAPLAATGFAIGLVQMTNP